MGDFCCYFKQLTIKFLWEGKQDKLCGIQHCKAKSPIECVPVSGLEQFCALQIEDEEATGLDKKQKEQLDKFLLSFEVVFGEPKSLPPRRNCDHAIILKQGSNPVNLKAYKYDPY